MSRCDPLQHYGISRPVSSSVTDYSIAFDIVYLLTLIGKVLDEFTHKTTI